MAFHDLRSYLDALKHYGQLVYIKDQVKPEPDISTYLRGACIVNKKGGPALSFENILGYQGKRVVGNVCGSWINHAIMLGMDPESTCYEQYKYLDSKWDEALQGQLVWVNDPPCQQVIIDKNINLYELLPLFRVNTHDGGFYLSKAAIVSQDYDEPDNIDKENVGMYRVQIQEPDILGMQVMPDHDFSLQLKRAEEENKPFPVTICIGNNPILSSIAATPLKYNESEFRMTAGFMGEPLRLTKCIGSNINVPADSEIIIEGEVIPRIRFPEGPFGEFVGSYSGCRQNVRIKVLRVTHRKDPIFENLYVGMPPTEQDVMAGLFTSVVTGRQIWERMPKYIKAVNAVQHHGMTLIIAADSRYGGYAKAVAYNAASCASGLSHGKVIIVIDGDKDPFDLETVIWALTFRVRPGKDVIVVSDDIGMGLDPCSEPPGLGGRLMIDATTPVFPDHMREIQLISSPKDAEQRAKEIIQLQNNEKRRQEK